MRVDHLVVGARTLEDGAAWCEAALGVAPVAGGRHVLFGTHNRLMAIGSAAFPDAYLEIIAIDPAAPPPLRARWFGLDHADFSTGPRLIHVVARCDDLVHQRQRLLDAGLQPGEALAASRDTAAGQLRWKILVRDDGALLCGGALPTLIEWQGPHPARTLPPSGVVLQRLELRGWHDRLRQTLVLPGVDTAGSGSPALRAVLQGPRGPVIWES